MFTKEFIIEAARQYKIEEDSSTLLRKMRILGIVNESVEFECNSMIKTAQDFNKSMVDYIASFIPDELKNQLDIIKISGCFAASTAGQYSINTEIAVHLSGKTLHLKFDSVNKCLYHQSWMEGNYAELLDKYFKDNPKFDAWIRF